jgi:hypothetical protein
MRGRKNKNICGEINWRERGGGLHAVIAYFLFLFFCYLYSIEKKGKTKEKKLKEN